MEKKLIHAYYDPRRPGSYGGVHSLWKEVGGSKAKVEEWLRQQDAYTLHRTRRKQFPRNRIVVAGLDDQWEADLVDVQSLAKENNHYKHLLTVIDSLSKYAWVIPLKDKTGDSLVKAFKEILKERQPRKLRTDKGTEFLNHKFQSLLQAKGIHFFTSNNETKAAIVERFNRTLKSRMWRYFTATDHQRYVDVLQDLVHSYNHTKHSSIGTAPALVNDENAEDVWRKLYKFKPKQSPKYKVGDMVRISKLKKTFEKGYSRNWTTEVFQITHIYRRTLPEYALADLDGEEITGKFMEPELQRVSKKKSIFHVEKVLRSKGKGKNKEVLVKFKDYPEKFNSWLPAKDVY
jgi:transposase InsO family protein